MPFFTVPPVPQYSFNFFVSALSSVVSIDTPVITVTPDPFRPFVCRCRFIALSDVMTRAGSLWQLHLYKDLWQRGQLLFPLVE